MVLNAIQKISCSLESLSEIRNRFWKSTAYKAILLILFSIFSTDTFCLTHNDGLIQVSQFEHGDLHERIMQVTKEISESPDSAFLFFKRGKLYFEHESFEASIADLDTAATLNYHGTICDLIYAKSYQQLNQSANAMRHVEQILQKDSFNINALKIKGTLFLEDEKYEAAADQFEIVIEHARKRLPENYLIAAKAWEGSTSEKSTEKAITILKKGIKDLGPLYIFHDKIISLYLKESLFKEALTIQEKIIDQAKRKEKPYYEAALISLQSGNLELAEDYLTKASTTIERLPLRIKNATTIKELKKNISELLLTIKNN